MAGGAVHQLPQRLVIGGGKTPADRSIFNFCSTTSTWMVAQCPVPRCYLCETCGAITNDTWRACRVHGVNSTSSVALQRAASPRHIDSEWAVLQCTVGLKFKVCICSP